MRDWTAPDDDITPPEPPPVPIAKAKRRRRFRPLLWVLEATGALVAALVLAVVLLAIRLEFGPVEVDFLTPMLVAYLNTQTDPLTVEIDRTSLGWVKGRSTVDLIGTQLRIADPSGNNVVSIPELSVSVNLRALIAGRFAASRVAIFGPHLRLIRAATGEVGIDLGSDTPAVTAGRPALAEPPPSLQDVWEAFAGKPSADRSLSYLDRISIEQADVTVDDRKAGLVWHIGEGAVDFTRRGDGLDAELVAALGVGQTETHLFGHLRYATEGKMLGFSLGWDAFDRRSSPRRCRRPTTLPPRRCACRSRARAGARSASAPMRSVRCMSSSMPGRAAWPIRSSPEAGLISPSLRSRPIMRRPTIG
ncbi:MAG: hypothetical protein WDN69_29345 [Aliidongia sp.]